MRLSGLSASHWDDATPESEHPGGWELESDSGPLVEVGIAAENNAVAEYRESVDREPFILSLTHCIPSSRKGRKNKSGKPAVDLTHTLFAAVELGCSVSDVAEEILSTAADEVNVANLNAVQGVVERLVASVEREAELATRQQHQANDDSLLRNNPM